MEDNGNYYIREKMKINDKVVFKAATSDDKLLREQGKRKEKSFLILTAACFLEFSPTPLQSFKISESNENAMII